MRATREDIACGRHNCEPDERWPEYDGRGIFLCYVCSDCEDAKLSGYRPEVLEGAYDCDEPIEPEDY